MDVIASRLAPNQAADFADADRLILDVLGLFHRAIPAPAGQDQYLTVRLSKID